MDGQLQIRYETKPSAGEYVSTEAWRDARLDVCPNHPEGGCSLRGHGTYGRKTPAAARVPRWCCRDSNTTFSKLADCVAARTPGTLDEVRAAVAAPGVQEAVCQARSGHHISDREAERRWIRWRAECVRRLLAVVVGLLPELLQGVAPEIAAFRARLGTESVLTDLRGLSFAGFLPVDGQGVPQSSSRRRARSPQPRHVPQEALLGCGATTFGPPRPFAEPQQLPGRRALARRARSCLRRQRG